LSEEEKTDADMGTHLLFQIKGLNCGRLYQYTLVSLNALQFQILPGIGENAGHLLQPAVFMAPPRIGDTHHVRLIASADQEGMDLIHHISIDDKIAKLLKLGLD